MHEINKVAESRQPRGFLSVQLSTAAPSMDYYIQTARCFLLRLHFMQPPDKPAASSHFNLLLSCCG